MKIIDNNGDDIPVILQELVIKGNEIVPGFGDAIRALFVNDHSASYQAQSDVLRLAKITKKGGKHYLIDNLELDELAAEFCQAEVGDIFTVEMVELTMKEIEQFPDFDGF